MQADVIGGSFTITKVGKDWDAKTPLTGTISIKYRDPATKNEKMIEGKIAVKGTGWG